MTEVVHVVTVLNVDISAIKGSGAFILEYATKPTVKVYADAKSAADYARERIEAVEKADGYKEHRPAVRVMHDVERGLVSETTIYPESYLKAGFLRVTHTAELVWRDPPHFGPDESTRMKTRAGGG